MAKETKEERYLIKHYELAKEKGDSSCEVSATDVAQKINEREKTVKNILKNLQQANFIKRVEDNLFVLTSNGLNLVKNISQ